MKTIQSKQSAEHKTFYLVLIAPSIASIRLSYKQQFHFITYSRILVNHHTYEITNRSMSVMPDHLREHATVLLQEA